MLGINRGRRKDKREAMGSPGGLAGKESAHNAGSPGFDPWVGKITWRRERLSTPVFWPREFHGHSPWSRKELDITELLLLHFTTEQLMDEKSQEKSKNMLRQMKIEICIPHLLECSKSSF